MKGQELELDPVRRPLAGEEAQFSSPASGWEAMIPVQSLKPKGSGCKEARESRR